MVLHGNNNHLSDFDKFDYLSSLLQKATTNVTGLIPNSACSKDAIDFIQAQDGSNERIIDNYMEIVIDLEPVKSKKDGSNLKKLYIDTDHNIT